MRTLLLAVAVLTVACTAPVPPARHAPTPHPSASAGARAFIPVAEKFVEQHRGLKFKRPVKVTFLSDSDFRVRVTTRTEKDRSDLNVEFKDLRALHLVPASLDILKAEDELLGSGVIGFYDPTTKELVVRGTDATAATRHVLVHELTHALQDQYYPLDALDNDNDDERPVAWRALIEGDAVRVENAYIATLTPGERSSLNSGGGQPPSDIPSVMIELLAFPYAVGPRFVDAVMTARGDNGLDAAFVSPPKTSTEVIHPDRFLAGFAPVNVAAPAAGGPEFDHGMLGEMGLTLLLERLMPRPLTASDARDLAQGWDGDRYVAWDAGAQSCLRATFAEDTQAHAARLAAAFSALPGATVTGNGPLTLTICG